MSTIRSKDTQPEIKLRKIIWSLGLRYRIYYGKEKIDIAFPKKKIAIFIDGCFWHQCPIHSHIPSSHREYWEPKLRKNIERAKAKDERLKALGWSTIHIWEHELVDETKTTIAIKRIRETLSKD
jgi:DNA mismatch endonuclease (patch repair protein)